MRKCLLFAVLLALPFGVAAQDKTTKKALESPAPVVIDKPRLPQGWRVLGLTDKQRKDVLALRAKYAVKRKSLEEQLKALKAEEKTKLLELLTDEQRQRLRK